MKSFANIFKNVFVITIERNARRRNYIEEVLKGIPFNFYYGLDLSKDFLQCQYVGDLPKEIFELYDLDRQHCFVWTKGQLGAFATGKKLIRDFALENPYEDLIVLLDDIVFEKNWKENLVSAYNELPHDWDALILSTRLGKAEKRAFRFLIGLKRRLDPFFNRNSRPLIRRYSSHLDVCHNNISGIFGIIYSPQGLQKLINEPDKLRKDQDDILIGKLVEQNYLNVYLTYPLLGKEGSYDGSWTQINDFVKG